MTVSFTTDTLGILAGTLTTLAFLPQLIKTWRSRSAEDVSIGMFLMFCTGVVLWGVYGWEIHALPVIATNVITFILAAAILILKLVYEWRSPAPTSENPNSTAAIEAEPITVATAREASETTLV
ncbi:MAG: SemiSWEET transporter [Cyanobacteria bacterium J06639_1]